MARDARSESADTAVLDALRQPVWTARPDGTVDYANPAWRAYTGLSPEASLGEGWANAVHPDDVPVVLARFRAATETGEPYAVDQRLRRADGVYRWHEVRVAPMRDAAGDVVGWAGTATDVDDRVRTEAALRGSEERYRRLFEAMDVGFCTIEVLFDAGGSATDYRFLEVNPAFAEQTGLGDAVGKRMRELAPAHEAHWFAAYGRVAATGQPMRFQNEAKQLGGRWYDVYAFPLGEPGDPEVGILFADVTERRRAEEAAARLAALVEGSRDAIVGRTLDGVLTSWNPGAEELYGYRAEEVVGSHVARFVPEGRAAEQAALAERLRRGERIPPFETVRLHKDGTPIDVEMSLSPIVDATGAVIGVSAIARDIRERRAARQLQEAFLEAVSHDLRTPLTAIVARAQLLGRRAARGQGVDAASVREATDAIVAAAKRQEAHLGELQDALRLQSGALLELAPATADLVALARDAARDAPAIPGRHRMSVEAAEPAVIGRWDALRIRRVLDNIVGNAVKYSPAGGDVTVAVSREERDDGAWAVLSVRDAGIGIPAADLPHLFERYRRGSNVGGRIAGTGIGLAGAKQIVGQHGGTIAIKSAEGLGTTVTVALPVAPPGTGA